MTNQRVTLGIICQAKQSENVKWVKLIFQKTLIHYFKALNLSNLRASFTV